MKKFLQNVLGITDLKKEIKALNEELEFNNKVEMIVKINGIDFGVKNMDAINVLIALDTCKDKLTLERENSLLCFSGCVIATTWAVRKYAYENIGERYTRDITGIQVK